MKKWLIVPKRKLMLNNMEKWQQERARERLKYGSLNLLKQAAIVILTFTGIACFYIFATKTFFWALGILMGLLAIITLGWVAVDVCRWCKYTYLDIKYAWFTKPDDEPSKLIEDESHGH